LEPGVGPDTVVIGLKALHEHFIFIMVGNRVFLLPRVSCTGHESRLLASGDAP
jgi:hypothetical protein